MPKEEVFRLSGGEIVTLTRKSAYEGSEFVVRPYTNKWYNCAGCRKRHNTNKHLLFADSSYSRSTCIYPRIPTCGSDVCLNMILLKKADSLKGYKNIVAVKQDEVADYVKCGNCGTWTGPGYNSRKIPFLQAYFVNSSGKETKFKTFCCLDCFKIHVSRPL